MKTVANHLGFGGELGFVCELLKVTAAATAEVRAWRLDPRWRWCEDLFDRGEQDVSLFAIDSYPKTITGRGERDKDCFSVRVGQPLAARKNSFHVDNH